MNKQTKLFGTCLEQLACDNLFITVYRYHTGCTGGGSVGTCCGAGDVAGVSSMNGLSEKVSEDTLDPLEDGGNESRVLSGEPSGVKTAGCNVTVDARANLPCRLQIHGVAR